MKTLLDAMKQTTLNDLKDIAFELFAIDHGEKKDPDGKNVETFTRLHLEIPRKNGIYSKFRFSCKIIPQLEDCFTPEELENGVLIKLHGLQITYIDARGNVYFKADSFEIF